MPVQDSRCEGMGDGERERLTLRGLSNIHDLIRVVNGIGRLVRVVRAVRVLKQWFTSRTSGELHIIGETSGVLQVVRLV